MAITRENLSTLKAKLEILNNHLSNPNNNLAPLNAGNAEVNLEELLKVRF